jgi:hypothetical protein
MIRHTLISRAISFCAKLSQDDFDINHLVQDVSLLNIRVLRDIHRHKNPPTEAALLKADIKT